MPDIKAVIFDVYETLAHNQPSLWHPTFAQLGLDYGLSLTSEEFWERWKSLELVFRKERHQRDSLGNMPPFKTYEQAWKDCFEQVFREIGKGDASDAARRCVVALGQRELFPETTEVVASLRRAGNLRLGIVSNADNDSLWPLLRHHGLEFDGVVTSEAAQAYKPHPRPFKMVVDMLKVRAQECLYVGDQQYDDISGGHAAGMQTAWVNRQGATLDPAMAMPDYQVSDLRGVLDIIGVSEKGRKSSASSRQA